ncbi:MAG: hypothetical protein KY445_01595, partial [Armatimonadetes bacterium]|nr:hypothetical protein [Armatimonadota bacterium]
AGVRFLHEGRHAQGPISVDIVKTDGQAETILSMDKADLEKTSGRVLNPIVPDRAAISGKELRVTPDKSLKEMEVWALQP